jgi:hypothetical protein
MISPAIARELRERGHDAQAVKRERPDLESLPDQDLLRRMTREQRAIVTNNIADFQPLHDRTLAQGEEHCGMLFTRDTTMPRNKANVSLWVETLASVLQQHQDDAAMRNRVRHIP